jgi:unsaturated rhamnogalacturonyl hydrolase
MQSSVRSRRIKLRLSLRTLVLSLTSLIALTTSCAAADKTFSKWPHGSSPKEIGERVAERFLASPHPNFGRAEPPSFITYPESVAWYGALAFAQASSDKNLTTRLIRRFDPLFAAESNLVPAPENVDKTVFGIVPLEIYMETREQKYLELGISLANRQWDDPRPDGLSNQSRFWIDDMYMITTLEVQAYRATNVPKYLDRAALEMTAYLNALQQPNGLFYHALDVPFFWGRGNGWVAAGITELLGSLPENHQARPRILQAYQQMMASLLKFQGSDGMWRQLLDHSEAWPEASCTAMFTFAMVTGVKNGWLDKKTYGQAARKGWLGLITYLEPNGDLRNVCVGTAKQNDLKYYLDRPRSTGDLHGQAPLLWCASAFLR